MSSLDKLKGKNYGYEYFETQTKLPTFKCKCGYRLTIHGLDHIRGKWYCRRCGKEITEADKIDPKREFIEYMRRLKENEY